MLLSIYKQILTEHPCHAIPQVYKKERHEAGLGYWEGLGGALEWEPRDRGFQR